MLVVRETQKLNALEPGYYNSWVARLTESSKSVELS
jgi:hypothetical protein